MAMVGINGQPCPSCGQTLTTEKQEFTTFPKREVYLECHNPSCGKKTHVGTYTMVGNSLVEV